MNKRVVIFDLDGVLVDSPAHVLRFFLDTYPTLTKGQMDEMLTGNFPQAMDEFKSTHTPIVETEEQNKKRHKEYTDKKAELPLYEGIQELLHSLHDKGYVLVVNTSALEKNCLPILEHAGISKLFDFVATKELATTKVEKFRTIGDKYKMLPSDMIFVTDTLGDVREADEANVPTIAVTYGAHDRTFFEREPHDNLVKVVDSVQDLREYLLS